MGKTSGEPEAFGVVKMNANKKSQNWLRNQQNL
jgi:hypothetical protein